MLIDIAIALAVAGLTLVSSCIIERCIRRKSQSLEDLPWKQKQSNLLVILVNNILLFLACYFWRKQYIQICKCRWKASRQLTCINLMGFLAKSFVKNIYASCVLFYSYICMILLSLFFLWPSGMKTALHTNIFA